MVCRRPTSSCASASPTTPSSSRTSTRCPRRSGSPTCCWRPSAFSTDRSMSYAAFRGVRPVELGRGVGDVAGSGARRPTNRDGARRCCRRWPRCRNHWPCSKSARQRACACTRTGTRTATTTSPQLGSSPVVFDCQVTGPAPIPAAMPSVVWRAGLDINPLDVAQRRGRALVDQPGLARTARPLRDAAPCRRRGARRHPSTSSAAISPPTSRRLRSRRRPRRPSSCSTRPCWPTSTTSSGRRSGARWQRSQRAANGVARPTKGRESWSTADAERLHPVRARPRRAAACRGEPARRMAALVVRWFSAAPTG